METLKVWKIQRKQSVTFDLTLKSTNNKNVLAGAFSFFMNALQKARYFNVIFLLLHLLIVAELA